MSYPSPRIIDSSGRTIRIAHPELPGSPKTALTSSVSATGTTLTVRDNSGLADDEWLLVGSRGSDKAEAVRINAAVTEGTSLTTTAVTFDHSAETPVERVLFDQWKIYGNSSDTTAGATLIATIDIRWDEPETAYVNAGTEYNYYFVIGYDSNAASTFTYSDGIPKDTGWAENTVGHAIEHAFETTKIERERAPVAWLLAEINECLREITGKLRRWSFLQVFDYSLGAVVRGTYSLTLPTDIEDPNSAKSIQGFRIGDDSDMEYIDKEKYEEYMDDVTRTQVTTQASAADTTLEIDNSYDFADSGSVDVFISGTKYTITYTGVTRSTTAGVLTGVPASGTGAITVTIPVDTDVWQNVEEGKPRVYTVWDGSLYFYPLADSSHDYTNALLDYYSKKNAVDQYNDTLDGPRHDAVGHWLKWKLRSLNNPDGQPDLKDGDYVMYLGVLSDLIKNEDLGQKKRWHYRKGGIDYGSGRT